MEENSADIVEPEALQEAYADTGLTPEAERVARKQQARADSEEAVRQAKAKAKPPVVRFPEECKGQLLVGHECDPPTALYAKPVEALSYACTCGLTWSNNGFSKSAGDPVYRLSWVLRPVQGRWVYR